MSVYMRVIFFQEWLRTRSENLCGFRFSFFSRRRQMREMSQARAFIVIEQYMLNFPLPLRVKHVKAYLEREKQINCNTPRVLSSLLV